MASPNLSELISTTLRNRSGIAANNVLKNNALLTVLSKRGNVKTFDGGRTIVQELTYAENSTYKRYSGNDLLNISASDVITAAEYNIAQAAVAVQINGLEQLQNAGREKVIDLLTTRINNAEDTMMNNISLDCYSDGTADGGKQIGGLQLLVADTPTSGTIGGISRSSYTFWRNQSFSGVTDGGAAVSTANITNYMNQLYLRTSRGMDAPNLIIADNNYFNFYWQAVQAIQRVMSLDGNDTAGMGFPSLKFMKADVVFDGGVGGGAPTNRMYFLNTKYIMFRPHKDRFVVPLENDRFAINQDAFVRLMAFAGNMTLSNGSLQGVLKP